MYKVLERMVVARAYDSYAGSSYYSIMFASAGFHPGSDHDVVYFVYPIKICDGWYITVVSADAYLFWSCIWIH